MYVYCTPGWRSTIMSWHMSESTWEFAWMFLQNNTKANIKQPLWSSGPGSHPTLVNVGKPMTFLAILNLKTSLGGDRSNIFSHTHSWLSILCSTQWMRVPLTARVILSSGGTFRRDTKSDIIVVGKDVAIWPTHELPRLQILGLRKKKTKVESKRWRSPLETKRDFHGRWFPEDTGDSVRERGVAPCCSSSEMR